MSPEANTPARVSIDSSLCSGHGRCYEVAPKLFHLDEDGYGQVTESVVAGEDRELAERVTQLCPELAVRVASMTSSGAS
jgi:ferredoxin